MMINVTSVQYFAFWIVLAFTGLVLGLYRMSKRNKI